jgi:AcrR family transcriptional regulator
LGIRSGTFTRSAKEVYNQSLCVIRLKDDEWGQSINMMKGFREDCKSTKGHLSINRIINAAATCISKQGVEKTSITAIALEAGVKRSLVAYHFPKKEMIFYYLVQSIVKEIEGLTVSFKGLPHQKQITACMETYIDFFQENDHYYDCFIHFFYLAGIKTEYRMLNVLFKEKVRIRLEYSLRQAFQEKHQKVTAKKVHDLFESLYVRLIGSILCIRTIGTTKEEQMKIKKAYFQIMKDEINAFYQ